MAVGHGVAAWVSHARAVSQQLLGGNAQSHGGGDHVPADCPVGGGGRGGVLAALEIALEFAGGVGYAEGGGDKHRSPLSIGTARGRRVATAVRRVRAA